jgi:Rap1a immunity proteins
MYKTVLLLASLLASLSTGASAEVAPGSGEAYLPACRNLALNAAQPSELTLASLTCAIDVDDLSGISRLLPTNIRFCKPADVGPPEMAGVVVSFLEAHRDRLQESFVMLAGYAFHDKWPCR